MSDVKELLQLVLGQMVPGRTLSKTEVLVRWTLSILALSGLAFANPLAPASHEVVVLESPAEELEDLAAADRSDTRDTNDPVAPR
jgi:hypothetical protein